jgi:hypothetical protein
MSNNENKHKHPIEVVLGRIEDEQLTPEEIARMKAEPEEKESTAFETAYMGKNGEITLKISRYLEDGSHILDMDKIKPGEKGYRAMVRRHKNLQPGDAHTIVQKLIEGKWLDT